MCELNFDPDKDILKVHSGTKRGLGNRPLLEKEILDAQNLAKSAKEAASILGVSYNTYKKYAKQYGLFENLKNPSGLGIPKASSPRNKVYSLDDLIKGKYPDYPTWKLKKRLIAAGYLPEKCDNCGFDEKRLTDGKVPLLLEFQDGNKRNHKWENIRLLCLNCYFLLNGNIFGKQKVIKF